jgi:hypothetical protein
MHPDVTHVRHVKDYVLELTFSDGVRAELDFGPKLATSGGVFEPLKDVEVFKQVRVDHELGTIVWPNDVDICPDVLYSRATGAPLPDFTDIEPPV